jgi:transcriptional regulator NrdR family protein
MKPAQTPQSQRGICCPQCGCRHFYTTHTEPLRDGRIRRRKICRHCGRKIVTFEVPLSSVVMSKREPPG